MMPAPLSRWPNRRPTTPVLVSQYFSQMLSYSSMSKLAFYHNLISELCCSSIYFMWFVCGDGVDPHLPFVSTSRGKTVFLTLKSFSNPLLALWAFEVEFNYDGKCQFFFHIQNSHEHWTIIWFIFSLPCSLCIYKVKSSLQLRTVLSGCYCFIDKLTRQASSVNVFLVTWF